MPFWFLLLLLILDLLYLRALGGDEIALLPKDNLAAIRVGKGQSKMLTFCSWFFNLISRR